MNFDDMSEWIIPFTDGSIDAEMFYLTHNIDGDYVVVSIRPHSQDKMFKYFQENGYHYKSLRETYNDGEVAYKPSLDVIVFSAGTSRRFEIDDFFVDRRIDIYTGSSGTMHAVVHMAHGSRNDKEYSFVISGDRDTIVQALGI